MTLRDALSLGRVSNLPTVWANAITAIVLTTAAPHWWAVLTVIVGLSLYYVAGMYLNDACDATIDALERPERPIPSGRVSRATVFSMTVLLFVVGSILIIVPSLLDANRSSSPVVWSAIELITCIVAYNLWHKSNPLSPVIMGLCRVMVYVTAAFALGGSLATPLITAAVLVLCYLIGLTYAAKQEHINTVSHQWPLVFLLLPLIALCLPVMGSQWIPAFQITLPTVEHMLLAAVWITLVSTVFVACYWIKRRQPRDIPNAVSVLIAGMCLVDAAVLAASGYAIAAIVATIFFLLTLVFQRFIAGT